MERIYYEAHGMEKMEEELELKQYEEMILRDEAIKKYNEEVWGNKE